MGYFYPPCHEIVLAIGLVLLALVSPLYFYARNTSTILFICRRQLGHLRQQAHMARPRPQSCPTLVLY